MLPQLFHLLGDLLEFQLLAQSQNKQGIARRGRLSLAHGIIETPVFMPVGTYGTVKAMSPLELNGIGAQIVLGNTFHLWLRPGIDVIAKHNGLHRFMAWDKPILTDSGGFQVFSLSGLRKISDEGVVFQSHLNGDRHLFTPEGTVDVQMAFNSDILMVLDECVGYPAEPREVRAAMERSVAWARRQFIHYREKHAARVATNTLFPIVQGGMDPVLRAACAGELVELNAEGYAIGGLSVGEPRELSLAMTDRKSVV